MDKKRRDFLKLAGISTLAGMGAPAAVNTLLSGTTPLAARASGHGKEAQSGGHAVPAAHGEERKPTGKRYAMVIDTRKFHELKGLAERCIDACHSLHNVPNFPDKKDQIKWIWLTGFENAFPEHSHYYSSEELETGQFLVTCNHCDNPPCVRACPTKATFKNQDGIIMMDFHRCIGCRFCMAACPYGSRSFNWRDPRSHIGKYNPDFPSRMRGVVEKCNFCSDRLADGLSPACVEACGETKAMVFGDLNDPNSEIRKVLKENTTIQRKPALGTHPSVFYII